MRSKPCTGAGLSGGGVLVPRRGSGEMPRRLRWNDVTVTLRRRTLSRSGDAITDFKSPPTWSHYGRRPLLAEGFTNSPSFRHLIIKSTRLIEVLRALKTSGSPFRVLAVVRAWLSSVLKGSRPPAVRHSFVPSNTLSYLPTLCECSCLLGGVYATLRPL